MTVDINFKDFFSESTRKTLNHPFPKTCKNTLLGQKYAFLALRNGSEFQIVDTESGTVLATQKGIDEAEVCEAAVISCPSSEVPQVSSLAESCAWRVYLSAHDLPSDGFYVVATEEHYWQRTTELYIFR